MNSNAKHAETNLNFCVFAMVMNLRPYAPRAEGEKPKGSYPHFPAPLRVPKGDRVALSLLPAAVPPAGSRERDP
jgi:hypothetical protein